MKTFLGIPWKRTRGHTPDFDDDPDWKGILTATGLVVVIIIALTLIF